MKSNEILEDLYRIREEHARACGYDVKTIFAHMKEHLKELETQGWRVVSPATREQPDTACALRDKPGEKGQP